MIKNDPVKKEANEPIENSVLLYDDKYFSILRHEHLKSFEIRYTETAFDLFHFVEIKKITDLVIKLLTQEIANGHKYGIWIINTIEGGPTIEKVSQKYIHDIFFPFLFENQIMTHLLCLSEEVISKLSMSLVAETDPTEQFNIQYFSKYQDCISYIKNCE